MSAPGFTAEASIYKQAGHYCAKSPLDWAKGKGGTVAALNFRPINWPIIFPVQLLPQISVTYQPPQPPFGKGFPGTLTIVGRYFAPDIDVAVTVCNCESDPFPIDPSPHTSPDRSACLAVPPYTCFTIPGGTFTATVSCSCGGGGLVAACDGPGGIAGPVAYVKAVDHFGNTADGNTAIPCQ